MEKHRKKKVRGGRTVAEEILLINMRRPFCLYLASMQYLTLLMKKVTKKVIQNIWERTVQINMFQSNMLDHESDDMPPQYQHIRHGPCSVKLQYYVTMLKLKSEFHLSKNQAQEAICTVANNLFGRKKYGELKQYERDEPTIYNTLPVISNTNKTEAYVEALIPAGIMNEIMSSEMDSCKIL